MQKFQQIEVPSEFPDSPAEYVLTEGNITLDYSRNFLDPSVASAMSDLYASQAVSEKILAMFSGKKVNTSENRAALHVACRSSFDPIPDIGAARHFAEVSSFASEVRQTPPDAIVVVGIGGSYLGTQFAYESLRHCCPEQGQLPLHFLANICPYALRNLVRFDLKGARDVLVVAVSKTFTTIEAMVNLYELLLALGKDLSAVVAVTSRPSPKSSFEATVRKAFPDSAADSRVFNGDFRAVFPLDESVGGRFSVSSCVGAVPISLALGPKVFAGFLEGCAEADRRFFENRDSPLAKIAAVLGLVDVLCRSRLGLGTKVVLPYCEALAFFPAHVQQLEMESNGKRAPKGSEGETGFFVFGEAGTKGQHSFYQLLHQGQVALCDFIGVAGEEGVQARILRANFEAQPDALALGRPHNDPNRRFGGLRPSNKIVLKRLSAQSVGQLLGVYEHRVAVQGFVWGLNSFDQMGVELGKEIALERM